MTCVAIFVKWPSQLMIYGNSSKGIRAIIVIFITLLRSIVWEDLIQKNLWAYFWGTAWLGLFWLLSCNYWIMSNVYHIKGKHKILRISCGRASDKGTGERKITYSPNPFQSTIIFHSIPWPIISHLKMRNNAQIFIAHCCAIGGSGALVKKSIYTKSDAESVGFDVGFY